jgi:hypothetical protein
LYLLQVSANNKTKSTQQQTKPNQPSNQKKKFMAIFGVADLVPWWVGIAGVVDLSPWSMGVAEVADLPPWSVGVIVVGGKSRVARGHPRAFASQHWGWREATPGHS